MKIFTWNIAGARSLSSKSLAAIAGALGEAKPDVVLFHEVASGDVQGRLALAMADSGLEHFHSTGTPESPRKKYCSAIASRWPLEAAPSAWAEGAPFPQLLARATVLHPKRAFDVIAAHAPNGSGNGWRKIETIQALLSGVVERERPLVVGGDFNEPVAWPAAGRPQSAAKRRAKTGDPYEGTWKRADKGAGTEDTRPRAEWQDAVEDVLLGTSSGLRHAFRSLHPDEVPTTYVTTKGTPRFFDHMLVSAEFEIAATGYRDDWRTHGLSDHSAGWAELDWR